MGGPLGVRGFVSLRGLLLGVMGFVSLRGPLLKVRGFVSLRDPLLKVVGLSGGSSKRGGDRAITSGRKTGGNSNKNFNNQKLTKYSLPIKEFLKTHPRWAPLRPYIYSNPPYDPTYDYYSPPRRPVSKSQYYHFTHSIAITAHS